ADLLERVDTAFTSVQESKQGRDELADQVSTLQAEIETLRAGAVGRESEQQTLRDALIEERAALSRAQEQAQANEGILAERESKLIKADQALADAARQLQAEIAERQRAESALAVSLEERADLQRELRTREERIHQQDTQVMDLQTRWQDVTQQMTT